MIYLFLFFSLVLFLLEYEWGKQKGNLIPYYFILIFLVLLTGLRYRVGIDTLNYMEIYTTMPTLDNMLDSDIFSTSINVLFVFLCGIAKLIGSDFFWIQLIHSLIVNVVIFFFVKENTKYRYTAVFIYVLTIYLHYNIEIMKESLAISMFLLSCKYYFEKKWSKYYFLICIAILFHLSALFLLFLPLCSGLRLNKRFYALASSIFLLSFFLKGTIVNFITLLTFNNEIIGRKIDNYFGEGWLSPTLSFQILQFFSVFVFPIFLVFLLRKLGVRLKFEPLICVYSLIGLLSINYPIFLRFSNYLILIYILYATEIIASIIRVRYFKKLTYLMSFLLIFIFSLPYLGKQLTSVVPNEIYRFHAWYPYHSIFDPEFESKREKYRDILF